MSKSALTAVDYRGKGDIESFNATGNGWFAVVVTDPKAIDDSVDFPLDTQLCTRGMSNKLLTEVWLADNCNGKYVVSGRLVMFQIYEDAVLFRMSIP